MRKDVLELYREIVADHDGITVKGKKTAYTAMNGNMFSFVDPAGTLCVRLSKEDKAAYEAEFGTGDVIQYGAVMRGYVPVVGAVLADGAALRALFAKAVKHAETLKPKATKRKST